MITKQDVVIFFLILIVWFSVEILAENDVKSTEIVKKAVKNSRESVPRHGVDFLGPLWLSRTFKIICCRKGTPIAENPNLVSNWTQTASDYAVDEKLMGAENNDHCREFQGTFLLSAAAFYNSSLMGYGVQCKCPTRNISESDENNEDQQHLDQHCRQLPPCQNGGYRSQSMGRRCACQQPYFGEFCEKMCDQGQVLVGIDGHNYCSCLPLYQGDTCAEMVCLNGGFEMRGRCSCPHNFLGYHCEIDTNRTKANSRYQRYGQTSAENNELFSRDISGTVFSLVMIIVLVVSMYLLMKHRMHVQSQFNNSRRDEMSRAAAIYGIERSAGGAATTISRDDMRILPFIAAGIQPPPPYIAARARRDEAALPPLPSYEDATKDTVTTGETRTRNNMEMHPTNTSSEQPSINSTSTISSPPPPFQESEDSDETSSPPPPQQRPSTIQRTVSTRRSL